MNFRIIALALIVASPNPLAYAQVRGWRDPPDNKPDTEPEDPYTEPEPASAEASAEEKPRTVRKPQPSSTYETASKTTPTRNRGNPNFPVEPSSPMISSSSTNDCVMYPVLKPWDNFWGKCSTYKPGSSNHPYCDEDEDSNGVLAENACKNCGKCKGPELMCVAFSKGRPFNAGWGKCDTYKKGKKNSNYDWCFDDKDKGIKAFQTCEECGVCAESAPRTVKIRLLSLKCVDEGDEHPNYRPVELYGTFTSQVGNKKRKLWDKKKSEFIRIDKGETKKIGKTHYDKDAADYETVSVTGTLYEEDFSQGVDDLGTQTKTIKVGDIYYKDKPETFELVFRDKVGTNVRARFLISVK